MSEQTVYDPARVREQVLARLKEIGVRFEMVEHAPVHTIEDCDAPAKALCAVVPKNLFLTPRNASAYHLLLIHPRAQFRTAEVSRQLDSSRLSFALADKLMEMMRTLPGAISPMGLLFDPEKRVRLAIDRSLLELPRLAFHPCVNTATIAMESAEFFEKYLPAIGRQPRYVEISREEQHEI